MWIIVFAAYGLILAGAPSVAQQPVPNEKASTKETSATVEGIEKVRKYLPLAAGNRWVYRVSVPNRGKAWSDYYSIEGAVRLYTRQGGSRWRDIQTVAYTIKQPSTEHEGFWEVDECVNGCGTSGARFKLWGPVIRTGMLYGKHVAYVADRALGRIVSGGRDEVLGHDEMLMWHTGLFQTVDVAEAVLDDAVNVSAGTFSHCLRITAQVWRGTTEESYFAVGVGLVRRMVKDNAGDINYILELTEYSVARVPGASGGSPRPK